MQIDLQIFRALVCAGEVVHMVEVVLRAEQIQAGQHLSAVDGTRIEIDFKHCPSSRLLQGNSSKNESDKVQEVFDKYDQKWEMRFVGHRKVKIIARINYSKEQTAGQPGLSGIPVLCSVPSTVR